LTVRTEKEDGKEVFYIVAGHRRLLAVRELLEEGVEIKAVPVLAVRMSEEALALDLIVSNDGEPLNQIEQGEVFQRLINYGWFVEEIATKTGKSGTHVQNCLAVYALPVEAKKKVFAGEMSSSQLLKMSREHGNGKDLTKKVEEAVTTAKAEGKTKATAKTVAKSEGKEKPFLSQESYDAILKAHGRLMSRELVDETGEAAIKVMEAAINKKFNIG
jgi:ParB-like chromosome segregation protein Spo0J